MKGKQSTVRKRSSSSRKRTSAQRRKPPAKKRSTGLWMLLIVVLLAMGGWGLARMPSGLLNIAGIVSIVVVAVILLFIATWFILRLRLTPTKRKWQHEQHMELVQLEKTACAIETRPLELNDLAHLSDAEFEHLTGALLEPV